MLGGERLQVGAVTGYITKRDQDDGALLLGLGDIDGGLVLGAYSAFSLGAFTFDAAILEKVTGDDAGPEYRLGLETQTRQVSERVKLGVRFGTTLASEDYMQTYFGVTPEQSRRSPGRASRLFARRWGQRRLRGAWSICRFERSLAPESGRALSPAPWRGGGQSRDPNRAPSFRYNRAWLPVQLAARTIRGCPIGQLLRALQRPLPFQRVR